MIPTVRHLVTAGVASAALAGCAEEPECPDDAACAAPSESAPAPSAGPLRGYFGGVLEVTFVHDDRPAQEAAASACGLSDAVQSPRPPTSRWFRLPDDLDAVTSCLRRDPGVLRVLQPQ